MTVPDGAASGEIKVTNAAGTSISSDHFTVLLLPQINTFSPPLGAIGTEVTVTGLNLTETIEVLFNDTLASNFTIEGDTSLVSVNQRTLPTFLGPPKHRPADPADAGEIGVANGLAWTEAGGEVLRIETTMTRGRGIMLTGQLGDVMKESGQAALTYARWRATELGIDDAALARHEIHLHVPAGAIPKDGPSAGIAMATAIVSMAAGIPIRADVAMTGEITLRGRVLPVGGVRDKALAALRAGISRIILPEPNMQDLEEIPRELKRKITFIPVTHMDEVLPAALERAPKSSKGPRSRSPGTASRVPVASAKSR